MTGRRIYFYEDDSENYIIHERDSAHIRVERIIWRMETKSIEFTGEIKDIGPEYFIHRYRCTHSGF
jgi:hypothetical protein